MGVAVLAFAALVARSVALAGFGLDSLIEIFASMVVVWELTGTTQPEREQKALRMIGTAFFALAVYVAVQGSFVLAAGDRSRTSPLGIAWTTITCIVMLALAAGKTRTGRALGNHVLTTEGRVTLIDAYLAAAVLLGLMLNATVDWWWADPSAAFVIVFYGIKEGLGAWSSKANQTRC